MKCLSLPGITNVWYIMPDDLPDDVVYRSVAEIPITLEVEPDEIALKGEAVWDQEESTLMLRIRDKDAVQYAD